MFDDESYRFAEAVHRDSSYGKRKKKTKEELERNEREKVVQEELNKQYEQVKKGVAQGKAVSVCLNLLFLINNSAVNRR